MEPKLGPGTDNARTVVGERSLTIDSPPGLASRPSRPSAPLVAVVAMIAACLLFGAGLVAVRHGAASTEPAPSAGPIALCWDGSVDGPQGCPRLEGREALEWMFTPTPAFRNCTRNEPDVARGELEAWQCEWPDVNAQVLISRWDRTQSAYGYLSGYFGQPTRADVVLGDQAGLEFSSLVPGGFHGDEPAYAFTYVAHPYSIVVRGPETERDRAVARLQPRDPSRIRI